MKSKIAGKLLRWYGKRHRSLPWRARPRPYSVWVAEVMAQQTRLETMLPYYRRWMRKFPTIKALTAASEHDVLACWEGLGYYSRARNLRRAAQVILNDFSGRLPRTVEELRRLPGIGRYTAGAIASLAFGMDEPAIDGNTIRVLSRVFDVRKAVGSAAGQKRFWHLATAHLPAGRAAEYNQALMDLGAQTCTPRSPRCMECPLRRDCSAYRLRVQEKRPVKAKASRIAQRIFAAAVIKNERAVLLRQRPPAGLLGGMWEFPSIQLKDHSRGKSKLAHLLRNDLGIRVSFNGREKKYQHTYSHFRADLRAHYTFLNGAHKLEKAKNPYRWERLAKLGDLPMGRLDRRIANDLRTRQNDA